MPESKLIEALIYIAISYEIEDFIAIAIDKLKVNSLVVNATFNDFLDTNRKDIAEIKNIDIILIFGDFLEMLYIQGHEFVCQYIRILYKNLKPKYSSPLIQKLKYTCRKAYFWSDEEAVNLFKEINEFVEECQYKGTNYEKSLAFFYKGLFLKGYSERNLGSINTYENINNYMSLLNKSVELGFCLANEYIKRLPQNDSNYISDYAYHNYDSDDDYDNDEEQDNSFVAQIDVDID